MGERSPRENDKLPEEGIGIVAERGREKHDYNIERRRNRIQRAGVAHRSKIRKQGLAQSILATELQRSADTCYYESGESRGRAYNVRSRRGAN